MSPTTDINTEPNLRLDQQTLPEVFGGKCSGLNRLLEYEKLGFKVPEFILLKDKDLTSAEDFINKYANKQIIARSNSLAEDRELSFAGIYDSVVVERTNRDDVENAVNEVFSSLNRSLAVDYRSEHGVTDDKMTVILQEYVEGDYYGVIFTTNPNFPSEARIQFSPYRDAVVDGGAEIYVADYNKKTEEVLFQNADVDESVNIRFQLKRLAKICTKLDKDLGPSDIEFILRDDEIYLVQQRPITEAIGETTVTIPDYNRSALIGATSLCRGVGVHTLPVVKLIDLDDFLNQPSLRMLERADPIGLEEIIISTYQNFFDTMDRLNKTYESGYVLLTPHIHETLFHNRAHLALRYNGLSFHERTNNKKAIVTTKFASPYAHAVTVARESGVQFAGFEKRGDIFDRLSTGDLISINFSKGRAHLYLEGKAEIKIDIKNIYSQTGLRMEQEKKSFTFHALRPYDPLDEFYEGFRQFFSQTTNSEWTFKENGGTIGGYFLDAEGRLIEMSGYKMSGRPTLRLSYIASYHKRAGKKFPKNEFINLMEKTVAHCQSR